MIFVWRLINTAINTFLISKCTFTVALDNRRKNLSLKQSFVTKINGPFFVILVFFYFSVWFLAKEILGTSTFTLWNRCPLCCSWDKTWSIFIDKDPLLGCCYNVMLFSFWSCIWHLWKNLSAIVKLHFLWNIDYAILICRCCYIYCNSSWY